ncbi:hypothetical protein VL00_16020 [Burkholderia cepacia]|nr:hypothetical protein VL00_16020 [Burkholderia cepacia]
MPIDGPFGAMRYAATAVNRIEKTPRRLDQCPVSGVRVRAVLLAGFMYAPDSHRGLHATGARLARQAL